MLSNYNLLYLDIETTGLNPEEDRILEIAWVLVDRSGQELSRSSFYILDYVHKIGIDDYEVHKIEKKYITTSGLKSKIVMSILREMLNKNIIVIGYNVGFDLHFIVNEFIRLNLNSSFPMSIDLMALVKNSFNSLNSYELENAVNELGMKDVKFNFHRAYDDCLACISIVKKNSICIDSNVITLFRPSLGYLVKQIDHSIINHLEIDINYLLESKKIFQFKLRPFLIKGKNLEAFDSKAKIKKLFSIEKILSIKYTGKKFPEVDKSLIEDN